MSVIIPLDNTDALRPIVKRVTRFLKTLSCLALPMCMLSTCTLVNGKAAPIDQYLDKRVTDSGTYKTLVPANPWEKGPPSDWMQQPRGCMHDIINTPGASNARRATHLAEGKHFAEAIGELTRAIDKYDGINRFGMSLDPSWLISRARLYMEIGRSEDALKDAERAVALKRSYDKEKFNAALIFTQFGKYAKAESVLPASSSVQPIAFRPYFSYLLAVLQQKQGKEDVAKQTFRESATLFAAEGMSLPAQSCFEAIAVMEGRKNAEGHTLDLASLEPPRSNYERVERLLKALATRSDVLAPDVLKGVIGSQILKSNTTEYFVNPHTAEFREIPLVSIDKVEGGGKRLFIQIEPALCSINKSALAGLLNHPVKPPEMWRKEVLYTEGYKVPAGTLVLAILKDGYNSIRFVQLYSQNAALSPPSISLGNENDSSLHKAHVRRIGVGEALQFGNIKFAETVVADWLREDPEDPQAHMNQAEILFKKGNLKGALASIDTAIKYGANGKPNTGYSENMLLIRKGTYLLEEGKFDDAYDLFRQSFPAKPYADLLLLRARAEIGLQKFADASNDLDQASRQFYDEGRIVRRDEADALLNSLRKANGSR